MGIDWEIITRLMNCFQGSFINQHSEFIAHDKANEYFRLSDCESEFDIKCKMLEWFSRGAFKTEPYRSTIKNKEFHNFMLNGINKFLDTNFTESDMDLIYTYLGNRCNHDLTVKFIESGYDMSVLNKEDTNNDNTTNQKEMV